MSRSEGAMAARILAVDDVSHNLDLMTYLLEASGHEVIGAATGMEAVARAQECHPDLVVLDIQLPDISGYRVLEELRADPDLADVPVIAVTAYAMVGDRDLALAAGFDDYLSKPIDPLTLVEALETHLPEERRGHSMQPLYRPRHSVGEEVSWRPS
ncbi:MAG TPA: response regulator [Jatrophihabitantaceae bacterium]|nr:response regulator [Jatrophihabitantaceae bacterium]